MIDHKRVSVIVPVWNNAAQLLRCIRALQDQEYPQHLYEVVVVDNGSTDDTAVRARETGVRVLEQPKPGSYAARNLAIAETHSQFLAFTDSDCVPDSRWLSTAMARAERESRLGVVAGRIVLFDDDADGSSWARSYEALVAFPQHQASEGTCATANWLSPRSAIVEAGGFDETVKSGGDHHMGIRLRNSGLKLVYEPDMIVHHPTRASFDALLAKRRRLTGGHWDRTTGPMRLPRAVARNLVETGRRGKKILVARDAPLSERLKAEAILVALGVADVGEYIRLGLGGSTVR
ncbi:glycosyltransferase family 2 protein [Novosphingobium sp. 9U]|uniref:glycosyltransferase n=1 Tax=Novosphingobium sp. 9U TaxID=2653158 RepID=UPI00135A9922|nr:glycosyltransferase [Novosphingobium sp. 9U]